MVRVAIVGYGVEGKVSFDYWSKRGDDVTIVDQRSSIADLPAGAKIIQGDAAFEQLDDFDMIIRSPGVPPRNLPANGKIWSATNEFFEKCPAAIIGVTGSKGKGTTSSLIAAILRADGQTVHLVGNIGVAALSVLPEVTASDVVVYELSSFQLWDIERSPQTAVVLPIEPDHLDVHENFEDYWQAKANIGRFQDAENRIIFSPNNAISRQIANLSIAGKLDYPSVEGAHFDQEQFYYGEQRLCPVSAVKLPGQHNLENACAAISAVWPLLTEISAIERGLASFSGLDHRLKFVREVDEVKYYDDSIATTPGSVVAAIRAFDEPKLLIMGGHDKGSDFQPLVNELKNSNVRKIFLIGVSASKLDQILATSSVEVELIGIRPMRDIINFVSSQARPGEIVILSPAAASFDMFENYQDRGDQFIAAVKEIK